MTEEDPIYQKKLEEDVRNPLEYGIGIIGGKWKSRLICILGSVGKMRFNELRHEMVSITDSMLATSLTELARFGVITKQTENGQTYYQITDKGVSLIPLLQELCQWAGQYYEDTDGIVMKHCKNCAYYQQWKSARESDGQEMENTPCQ